MPVKVVDREKVYVAVIDEGQRVRTSKVICVFALLPQRRIQNKGQYQRQQVRDGLTKSEVTKLIFITIGTTPVFYTFI